MTHNKLLEMANTLYSINSRSDIIGKKIIKLDIENKIN